MSAQRASSGNELDRASGLLLSDAPPRAARYTGWLLLALAAAAIAFACLFRIPETVVAPFVVVPIEGGAPIQAPVAGELVSVDVREGQSVKAGATLFRIKSDVSRSADSLLRQLLEDQRALTERTRRLDQALGDATAIKDREIALTERELEFRRTYFASTREILDRKEKAAADGLLPRISLLSDRLLVAAAENERIASERQLQQLALDKSERVAARSRDRNEEAAESEKLTFRIAAARAQLAGADGDTRSLLAPYDAVVMSVAQTGAGAVVDIGAELCLLARIDAAGQPRLTLAEAALPRLHSGQSVRLFLSAYPYQRYGTQTAQLDWVSPSGLVDKQQTQFFALASLTSPTNPDLPLRIGMRGEARILVGRRTLIDYALEPVRALRERAFVE
jgi:multidrug efflux pump subunit AcrA (membrane-fusion protein)